MKDRLAR